MRYLEFASDPRLAPYVRLLWTLELDAAPGPGPVERILPDGVVELVFHYREPFEMRAAGGGFAAQPEAFAVLQTRRHVEIRPRGASGFVSVRFEPWGFRPFVSLPLAEIADAAVPATELWGTGVVDALRGRLERSRSPLERVGHVQRFLLSRVSDSVRADTSTMERLVRLVRARRGAGRVSELSRDVGWSERRLQRRCLDALGVSPKRLARLTRFLGACRELRRNVRSLTEIAHDCGYFDQAHFIGEFRELAGETPGDLRKREGVSFLDV